MQINEKDFGAMIAVRKKEVAVFNIDALKAKVKFDSLTIKIGAICYSETGHTKKGKDALRLQEQVTGKQKKICGK